MVGLYREEFRKEIKNIKPFKGIKNVFSELKKQNIRIGIVTTNSEGNVRKFLRCNGFINFDFINSGIGIFGKDRVIKAILEEYKLMLNEVIVIGDEVRDVLAAKKIGIKIIAVAWGYNSDKILKQQNPDYLAQNSKQLLKILKYWVNTKNL